MEQPAPDSDSGRYTWVLSTVALFTLEAVVNGFFITCSLRSSNPSRAGLPVLLLNTWATNAVDGGLLVAGRVAAHLLQIDTGSNGTAPLILHPDRGYSDSWLITLHLGVPLKTATHALSNLLGLALCVDTAFLSTQPGFKSQVGRATMGQRRALDYTGLSWIVSLFLMCHPLVLSFVDTTAFLVVLYTWCVYMGLATFITLGLALSVCCRRQLRPLEDAEDMLDPPPHHLELEDVAATSTDHRTKVLSIILQLGLVLGLMLPWPLFETLRLTHSTRHIIVRAVQSGLGTPYQFTIFWETLRVLPLLYYILQPACILLFREVRDRLPASNARIRRGVKIHGHMRAQFRPLTRDFHDAGRDTGELSEIESVL